MKDDEALLQYLTQSALDKAELFSKDVTYSGVALEDLINHYRRVLITIKRISKRYPAAFLELLIIFQNKFRKFSDEHSMKSWAKEMETALNLKQN